MVGCSVATRSIVALLFFTAVTATPIPTPKPAVPVQISTTTDNLLFTVMRDSLIFLPPDASFYVARQYWRDSIAVPTSYASLQIYNPSAASGSLNTVNPRRFITRNRGPQPQNFTLNDVFGALEEEARLFEMKCCGCTGGLAPVTFYSTQGNEPVMLSTEIDANGDFVKLRLQATQMPRLCTLSNLKIQAFPVVERKLVTSLNRRRRSTDTLHNVAIVQLLVDYGNETFVVGVQKSAASDSFGLSILPYNNRTCTIATTFYYKEYNESHVDGTSGKIISRLAFTLQHTASRLYVATDVLDNTALNIAGTGLILQNEADFSSEPTEFPDYRFFSRYDDRGENFLKDPNSPPYRPKGYYNRAVHIFCALHHRTYCLQPARSGLLRLTSVSGNNTAAYPTLETPSPVFSQVFNTLPFINSFSGFFNFLESLDGISVIPTFNIVPFAGAPASGVINAGKKINTNYQNQNKNVFNPN